MDTRIEGGGYCGLVRYVATSSGAWPLTLLRAGAFSSSTTVTSYFDAAALAGGAAASGIDPEIAVAASSVLLR